MKKHVTYTITLEEVRNSVKDNNEKAMIFHKERIFKEFKDAIILTKGDVSCPLFTNCMEDIVYNCDVMEYPKDESCHGSMIIFIKDHHSLIIPDTASSLLKDDFEFTINVVEDDKVLFSIKSEDI